MSVTVHIKYKDFEGIFSGDADEVWVDVNRFFSQKIPHFTIARSALLTVDLKEVVEASRNIVAVAEEGPVVLVPKKKLTDRENLLLILLAAYVGGRLGLWERLWLNGNELQVWLGKSGKITSTRLNELSRQGIVTKTENGGYQLSTYGAKFLVEEVLPKIKNKI